MERYLLLFHSGIRYVIVLLLLGSLISAYSGWKGKMPYHVFVKRLHNSTRLLLILQMLLGATLYYVLGFYKLVGHISTLPEQLSFFALGHVTVMFIAIIVINIGFRVAMKAASDKWKYRRIAIFYSIGFILIFMAIPWPFLHKWATWI